MASAGFVITGSSVSDAVRILLKRVVNDQAFPLELKVPNAQTRAAMEEARAMAKARTTRFDSANALIDDLESEPGAKPVCGGFADAAHRALDLAGR